MELYSWPAPSAGRRSSDRPSGGPVYPAHLRSERPAPRPRRVLDPNVVAARLEDGHDLALAQYTHCFGGGRGRVDERRPPPDDGAGGAGGPAGHGDGRDRETEQER